jgi:hypothetical protein
VHAARQIEIVFYYDFFGCRACDVRHLECVLPRALCTRALMRFGEPLLEFSHTQLLRGNGFALFDALACFANK